MFYSTQWLQLWRDSNLINMAAITDLQTLLKQVKPVLNPGQYVFCTVEELTKEYAVNALMMFNEAEGYTLIVRKQVADVFSLEYSFIASWITLTVHSSLSAVGLTAAFSKALADYAISCNVVAGFYHDHIFVAEQDASLAIEILTKLSER